MPILDRICFGCNTSIDDQYYLMTVNNSWHLSCLKCSDCGLLLENEQTCFTKYGQTFCKDDYIKRYCSRGCTRCDKIIKQDEIILRVEQFIFHLNCFTCIICNILLHPGDDFGLKNNLIYCHNHLFEQQTYNSDIILDDSGYHTSSNEIFKSKNSLRTYYISRDDNQLNKSYHTRHKRLRTSFKHNQLRYMRSYFNLNHNPDAKDLKNLSEKTNLPKRVLQVWFQNARAKYRRSNTILKEDKTILLSPENFNQSETCISIS